MLTVRVHGLYIIIIIIIIMCVCLNEEHVFCYPPKTYIYIYMTDDVRAVAVYTSRKNTLCRGGYYSHVLRTVCGIGTIR
jgi:hypothetical protein